MFSAKERHSEIKMSHPTRKYQWQNMVRLLRKPRKRTNETYSHVYTMFYTSRSLPIPSTPLSYSSSFHQSHHLLLLPLCLSNAVQCFLCRCLHATRWCAPYITPLRYVLTWWLLQSEAKLRTLQNHVWTKTKTWVTAASLLITDLARSMSLCL